jgi:hypothetical protein
VSRAAVNAKHLKALQVSLKKISSRLTTTTIPMMMMSVMCIQLNTYRRQARHLMPAMRRGLPQYGHFIY